MTRRLLSDGFDFLNLADPEKMRPDSGPLVDVPAELHGRLVRALKELAEIDDEIRQRYASALYEWERAQASDRTADVSASTERQARGGNPGTTGRSG